VRYPGSVSFTSPSPPNDGATNISTLHTVETRKHRPVNARAIIGGILVATAALGAYVTAAGSGDHRTLVVVAGRDIPVGTKLEPSDLKLERMQLTPQGQSRTSNSVSHLVGQITLGPIGQNELVQKSLLEPVTGTEPALQPQISVAMPAARALGGNLRPGDRVDVINTDKTAGSLTTIIATNVEVISVVEGSNNIGQSSDATVTFAVSDANVATAIAAGADQGQLTLVRVTGTGQDGNQ
jgi:Flp pilus assembly protein CpaB